MSLDIDPRWREGFLEGLYGADWTKDPGGTMWFDGFEAGFRGKRLVEQGECTIEQYYQQHLSPTWGDRHGMKLVAAIGVSVPIGLILWDIFVT